MESVWAGNLQTKIEKRCRMTKISRSVIVVLALGALVAGLSGCHKKEDTAERAGKEIDKAVDKTGQGINKAVGKAGEKIEKAGEKMQDAAKGVKK
jgi:hypothetical protein